MHRNEYPATGDSGLMGPCVGGRVGFPRTDHALLSVAVGAAQVRGAADEDQRRGGAETAQHHAHGQYPLSTQSVLAHFQRVWVGKGARERVCVCVCVCVCVHHEYTPLCVFRRISTRCARARWCWRSN